MQLSQIAENVRRIKKELSCGNAYGEKITLVAATKTQSEETINAAIAAGLEVVAENKVQEYRDKQNLLPCEKHFIGHLQLNKVKYLIGGVSLIHSCDRDELAQEISRLSIQKKTITSVLIQVNIGEEESKGGYLLKDAYDAFLRTSRLQNVKVEGFMAMLPASPSKALAEALISDMRKLYEKAKKENEDVKYLSMGMSGDYELCIRGGSNMVRLGSSIFGERHYD